MRWLRRKRRTDDAKAHRSGCARCGSSERVERFVAAHDDVGGDAAYVLCCGGCGLEVAVIRASAAA
jgi:transcription elongation factor Elf1